MAILVTGSTGTIGSKVVRHLAEQGAQVRARLGEMKKAAFPPGVNAVEETAAEWRRAEER